MTSAARAAATVGFVTSWGLVAILHVVRTDLPPAAHRLSEYAIGPYGWMMTTSFVTLGCGLVALGLTLRSEGRWERGLWGTTALASVAGAGSILSAVFPTGTSDADESIHSPASALAVVATVGLALAHSNAARRSETTPDITGTALAVIALGLALLSPLLHHTQWTGFSQRALWIVLTIWLLRTTRRRPRMSPSMVFGCDGNDLVDRQGRPSDRAEEGG